MSIGKTVTVEAGDGNDTVNITPAGRNLVSIQGNVTVNAGAGLDAFTINDQAFTGATTYTLAGGPNFTRTGVGLIAFTGFNNGVTINGGSGTTTFDVIGTLSAGWPMTLNTGPGVNTVNVRATVGPVTVNGEGNLDVVNVGNAGMVATILGTLTVTNRPLGAYTALTVDASADTVGCTVTFDSGSITNLAPAQIVYLPADMRSVTVTLGTGADTLNVLNTDTSGYAGGLLTTVYAGANNDTVNVERTTGRLFVSGDGGDDTFHVSPAAHNLSDIQGELGINGHFGVDVANFYDQSHTADSTYTLDGGGPYLSRPGAARIQYNTITRATLHGGSGNTTFMLTPYASHDTTVNLGPGDNTVYVQGFVGTYQLNGQGGSDTLVGPDSANTWTLTGSDAGDLNGVAAFTSVEYLNGGGDSDRFVVVGGAGVSGYVDGGAGGNSLVGPDMLNLWFLLVPDLGVLNSFVYLGVQNLVGGTDVDLFTFLVEGAAISGALDGGGGDNLLDYSVYASDVTVNLTLGTATDVGGPLANVQHAAGGSGNDILVGDNATNLLYGGPGRDLLIGGGEDYSFHTDLLLGGEGENILIAGFTAYDRDPAALAAILAEWARGDIDYYERSQNLFGGFGVPRLNPSTVFSNYGGNYVQGDPASLDLYFVHPEFDTHDRGPEEYIIEIF